jgi:hypothetical protein
MSVYTACVAMCRTAARAGLFIFDGSMVSVATVCLREKQLPRQRRKGKRTMNRAWIEVMVALLLAATETLVEVVKRLKEKGTAPS